MEGEMISILKNLQNEQKKKYTFMHLCNRQYCILLRRNRKVVRGKMVRAC